MGEGVTAAGARSKRLLASAGACLGLLLAAGAVPAALGAADGKLTVWVGGGAAASVTVPSADTVCPGGQDVGCELTLPRGSVELRANGPSFLAWSDEACGSSPTCVVDVTDETTIVATFAPLTLALRVAGAGTVTARKVGGPELLSCTAVPPPPETEPEVTECSVELHEITEVDFTAAPTDTTKTPPVEWNPGTFCDPGPDVDAAAPLTCRATVALTPFDVHVGLGVPAPSQNFQVRVAMRISLGGAGQGAVSGVVRGNAKVFDNCTSDCTATVDYGQKIRFTATATGDSVFRGFEGEACSASPTCTVAAGAVTRLRLVFDRKPAAAPPPPAPPAPPPLPPPPPPPPTVGPGPDRKAAFAARIVGASVGRVRGGRVVLVRVDVNDVASARGRVARGPRVLAERTFALRPGASTLRLPLRRAVARGLAWVAVTFRSADATKSLRLRVAIPRP